MGTGASSASSRSPSPEMALQQRINNRMSSSDTASLKDSLGMNLTKWKGHNVISNEVAPILITKGCFEEYQCTMLAVKQSVTKGRIHTGLPEHALIQVSLSNLMNDGEVGVYFSEQFVVEENKKGTPK